METTNFKKIIDIAFRNKIYIIGIICIFIMLGLLYTFLGVKAAYKSTTTFVLGMQTSVSSENSNTENQNPIIRTSLKLDSQTIATYGELIKSNTSINTIKNNLKIDINHKELEKSISVERIHKSDLIKITAKHTDKEMAKNIANETVKVFSDKIKEIYQLSEVYVIDIASIPENPYNVNHGRDIAIFAIFGIFIGFIYCVAISILDKTIKSPEAIEEEIGLKVLVSIPNKKTKKQSLEKLIDFQKEKSPVLEAFKTLRANVQFTNIHNKNNKVMLITSCLSSEGKSYVAANLAAAFAQVGKKVILIDTDMRAGRQSSIFGIPNNLGISNYLANLDTNGIEINERINSYINETSIKNLNVITSGSIPPNTSELLSSEKLPELIKDLSVFYDFIILDGAPVLPVTDSLILAKLARTTILVSLDNKTQKEQLRKVKIDLQKNGARIIGVVFNQASSKNKIVKNAYLKLEVKKLKEKVNKNNKKADIRNIVLKIKNWMLKHIKKREKKLLLEQKKESIESLVLKDSYKEQKNEVYRENKIQKENIKEKIAQDDEENIEKNRELIIKRDIQENSELLLKKDIQENSELLLKKNIEENNEFLSEKSIKENDEYVKKKKYNRKKRLLKKFSKLKEKLIKVKDKIFLKVKQIQNQLAKVKEKSKIENKAKAEEKKIRKELLKEKELQEKEEKRKNKEEKKQRQKEEARLKGDLLEDNLYPKTKYDKNL